MSFFDKVLGKRKPKAKSPPPLPSAIQQLKQTEDVLLKKQDYLENKIKKETDIARQNATKNKKVALQALKRKKRYESQLQQTDGAITTLEGQREVLENANINNLAISSMKNARDALKSTQKGYDSDAVNKIMEDLAEQKEVADEISDALVAPVDFGASFDEDELEQELKELTGELDDISLDDLPAVPQQNVKRKEKKKEKPPAVPVS